MYLSNLELKNIKLLKDGELSFLRMDGKPRMWTVVIGENGMCKTALLQCIGAAAMGAARANKAIDASSFVNRRRGPLKAGAGGKTAVIEGTFLNPAKDLSKSWEKLISRLLTQKPTNVFEDQPEVIGAVNYAFNPLDGEPTSVACGYGVFRQLAVPGLLETVGDAAYQRMASLYAPSSRIIGNGFADCLEDGAEFCEVLNEALQKGGLVPAVSEIRLQRPVIKRDLTDLRESHVVAMPMSSGESLHIPTLWLSSGSQALMSWVADIIGQFFVSNQGPLRLDEMRGLVLIDEIDLHLHPRWQVRLVQGLKRAFPNVQFVATTHSPLILAGLEKDEIWEAKLNPGSGDVEILPMNINPALMTPTELFQRFFDVEVQDANRWKGLRQRYHFLACDPARSASEELEVQELLAQMRSAGIDPLMEPEPRAQPKRRRKS